MKKHLHKNLKFGLIFAKEKWKGLVVISTKVFKRIIPVCSAFTIFVSSSFATEPTPNIASDAASATCNNGTLETYNGTTNLKANWKPNTIELTWYEDSEATEPMTVPVESQSCEYGGALTPPPPPAARTGYTFRGWRIRPKPRQTCGIGSLEVSTDGDAGGLQYASGDGYNQSIYGLSTNNTWAAEFNYGVVYGRALCSSISGNYGQVSSPANTNGGNCWCQVTGFAPAPGPYTSGPTCTVSPAPSRWVYYANYELSGSCAAYCVEACSNDVLVEADFRSALYGAVGQ